MAFRVMKSVREERAPAVRRGPLQLWPEHSSAGMREAPDAGKDRRKAVSQPRLHLTWDWGWFVFHQPEWKDLIAGGARGETLRSGDTLALD